MRVLFFGYHSVGSACLPVLLEFGSGATVAALVTHEDDPDEEVWFETPGPIAREAGIEILTPSKAELGSTEFRERVRSLAPDLILSVYYRYMIPMSVLEVAPLGGVNLHGSYLPEYRGRCPVNWQVLHGATRGGVTLHRMVEAPDAGDILAQKPVALGSRETARSLYLKLVPAAELLFRETWPRIASGDVSGTPQDHSAASYFGGRGPEDGRIDWSEGVANVDRLVRAVTHPYPGAFTEWRGRRLFIWEAAPVKGAESAQVGQLELRRGKILIHDGRGGALRVGSIQPEGEDELSPAAFILRYPEADGAVLGAAGPRRGGGTPG